MQKAPVREDKERKWIIFERGKESFGFGKLREKASDEFSFLIRNFEDSVHYFLPKTSMNLKCNIYAFTYARYLCGAKRVPKKENWISRKWKLIEFLNQIYNFEEAPRMSITLKSLEKISAIHHRFLFSIYLLQGVQVSHQAKKISSEISPS